MEGLGGYQLGCFVNYPTFIDFLCFYVKIYIRWGRLLETYSMSNVHEKFEIDDTLPHDYVPGARENQRLGLALIALAVILLLLIA